MGIANKDGSRLARGVCAARGFGHFVAVAHAADDVLLHAVHALFRSLRSVIREVKFRLSRSAFHHADGQLAAKITLDMRGFVTPAPGAQDVHADHGEITSIPYGAQNNGILYYGLADALFRDIFHFLHTLHAPSG